MTNRKVLKKIPKFTKDGQTFRDRIRLKDRTILVNVFDDIPKVLEVPSYGVLTLDPLKCSTYIRMAALEIFGLHYSYSDSWNRKYNDELIYEVGFSSLEELAEKKILKPGMILGLYNPESKYRGYIDKLGQPNKYTHVALYLGLNDIHKPIFVDQFIANTLIRDEKAYRKAKLIPIDIIGEKKTGEVK